MRVLAALVVALACACAHGKSDETICPEDRGQRCLVGQECTLDKDRGCKVCRCENAGQTGPDGKPTLPDPPR